MKQIIFILLTAFSFTACKNEEKIIEFKKIENIDLGNISKENATMHGTATFMNSSDKEFNLKDLVLDLIIDGKDVGTIVVKNDKVIKPNAEFSIPLKYTYETASIVETGHDPSTTYAVQINGDLNVKDKDGNEVTTSLKYATTYEYQTKKEIREEKRETRKEERQKRREERKEKRNN